MLLSTAIWWYMSFLSYCELSPRLKYVAVSTSHGRAIAQAVNRRLPTAAARVKTRVWSCGILWWTKWLWGKFSPRTSVFPANLHSICFSTIFFTITRGWHNKPRVAAVPIASQTKSKKVQAITDFPLNAPNLLIHFSCYFLIDISIHGFLSLFKLWNKRKGAQHTAYSYFLFRSS
jgi:hypothetical protein